MLLGSNVLGLGLGLGLGLLTVEIVVGKGAAHRQEVAALVVLWQRMLSADLDHLVHHVTDCSAGQLRDLGVVLECVVSWRALSGDKTPRLTMGHR